MKITAASIEVCGNTCRGISQFSKDMININNFTKVQLNPPELFLCTSLTVT